MPDLTTELQPINQNRNALDTTLCAWKKWGIVFKIRTFVFFQLVEENGVDQARSSARTRNEKLSCR